eukprot:2514580-Prymnesium_polylepis.1
MSHVLEYRPFRVTYSQWPRCALPRPQGDGPVLPQRRRVRPRRSSTSRVPAAERAADSGSGFGFGSASAGLEPAICRDE